MESVPFITAAVFSLIFAAFADWLVIDERLSITNTRKFVNYFSMIGSAVCFVILGFVGCNQVLAEVVIVLNVTLNSAAMVGYMVRIIVKHLKHLENSYNVSFLHRFIALILVPTTQP